MSLFSQWRDLIDNQTDDTFEEFWKEYSGAEKAIYAGLLGTYPAGLTGQVQELADQFEVRLPIFMGFLDGINPSLPDPMDLDAVTGESRIVLMPEYETLYFNMMDAKADYLYSLPQWDAILSEEKKIEITKAFKKSKTVIKDKAPGRNDPCPCGSGKKYKKCCGA